MWVVGGRGLGWAQEGGGGGGGGGSGVERSGEVCQHSVSGTEHSGSAHVVPSKCKLSEVNTGCPREVQVV